MSNYLPIIVDASGNVGVFKELPASDNLDFTSSGIVNLNVANLQLNGGSAGQVIQTDGAGNLSFVSPAAGSSISNGSSNVSIALTNGNIQTFVNGTSTGVFENSLGVAGLPGLKTQAIGESSSYIYFTNNQMYFYPNGVVNAFELNSGGSAVFRRYQETQQGSYNVGGNYSTWGNPTNLSNGSIWRYLLQSNITIDKSQIKSQSGGTISSGPGGTTGISWIWILDNNAGYTMNTGSDIYWAGGNKTLTSSYNIIAFYYDGNSDEMFASLTSGYTV